MSYFSFDEMNDLIQKILHNKTFNTIKNEMLEDTSDTYATTYVDFINLFCFLNKIRNGAHLDGFTTQGCYDLIEPDYKFSIKGDKNIYIEELISEVNKLSLSDSRFSWIRFNQHYELTFWNSMKISPIQILNSIAFGEMEKGEYWNNMRLLLGGDLGYPTNPEDEEYRGQWNLKLTINIDGDCDSVSLCGGFYDKRKDDNLDFILFLDEFLHTHVKNKRLYHPDGKSVYLSDTEITIE